MNAMKFKPILAIAGFAAATLGAGLAMAQDSISALKGHDPDAPIDVTADRIEVQDRSDRAVFAGNVQVRQASLTLDTERLTLGEQDGGSHAEHDTAR